MLPRLIDSALLREWTVQSLIVDRTHLVQASGKLVLQKSRHRAKITGLRAHPTPLLLYSKNLQLLSVLNSPVSVESLKQHWAMLLRGPGNVGL